MPIRFTPNAQVRSVLIRWTAGLMNWNSRVFAPRHADDDINWRDHGRWWIEGKLETLFTWAYVGSAEEIQDGIEHARDGVADEYLTERQLEIKRRWPEWIDAEPV